MSKDVNLIADTIVYAVQNQKPKVTQLLLINGVVVPSGTSDAKLILLVSDVFQKSKPFRDGFISLIGNTEYISSSFDGYSNAFGDYGIDPIDFTYKAPASLTTSSPLTSTSVLNSNPAVSTANSGSASAPSFWSTSNLMGLLNKAADTYTTVSTNKANTALANAATVRAQNGIVDGGAVSPAAAAAAAASKGNTTLYVILAVVAIGAIGGFVWYKSKK